MLVLTRKKGERIRIGDDIEVQILDCGTEGVKIGIKAPRDISILRSELYASVVNENQNAQWGTLTPELLNKQLNQLKINKKL